MTPEEKEGWSALLMNGLNPSRWRYVASRPHERREPKVTTHEFKNIKTGDYVQLVHVDPGAKKKKWRIFSET